MAGASTAAKAPKAPKTNRIGLSKKDYGGSKTTLCIGCGHDLITARLIDALYETNQRPEMIAKLSGIGCSSKTPAYFVSRAHSFNAVHGRMPSIATGAGVANRNLKLIGVSGDGDSANIGLGQFLHVMRRNLNMVYIVENNGVYGLTKGQFSATADLGSKLKSGVENLFACMDLCALAMECGCKFVARLYAGNTKMMRQVTQAAMAYNGTAFLDIISPCVTFNNHADSTKSFPFMKENEQALQDIGFVPSYEPDYAELDHGEEMEITLSNGSHITIKALERDYDPTDPVAARRVLAEDKAQQKVVTGIIYIEKDGNTLADVMSMVDDPLATLPQERVRPSREVLEEIMDSVS